MALVSFESRDYFTGDLIKEQYVLYICIDNKIKYQSLAVDGTCKIELPDGEYWVRQEKIMEEQELITAELFKIRVEGDMTVEIKNTVKQYKGDFKKYKKDKKNVTVNEQDCWAVLKDLEKKGNKPIVAAKHIFGKHKKEFLTVIKYI